MNRPRNTESKACECAWSLIDSTTLLCTSCGRYNARLAQITADLWGDRPASRLYPTLMAYRTNLLPMLYQTEQMEQYEANGIEIRYEVAGHLAAAMLAWRAGHEMQQLEAEIKRARTEPALLTEEMISLYDWLVDEKTPNIRAYLIDRSGTRTILLDMQDIEEEFSRTKTEA